jgi:hypothetical protein
VPLVEERELYLVGYGPVEAPSATWSRPGPNLRLSQADIAALTSAHGAADLWVMQIGTFDQSPALLLTSLS